jgi:hypothetical protein
MITEYTSATLIPPACIARVDAFGNLVIDVHIDVHEEASA